MALRTFERKPGEPFVGSVSCVSTWNTCQRQFYHNYIAKTSKDIDWKSPTYFSFGSAFHSCLELSRYDHNKCDTQLMRYCCNEHGLMWDNDGAKLAACLRSYFASAKPLKIIDMEVEVITDDWVFYVDAVAEDESWWYLLDNKTTGVKLDPTIRTKLTVDPQMVLYASYAEQVAKKLNLPMEKFFGINYREVEKPRQRWKDGESWESFTQRCGTPDFREVELSKHQLRVKEVASNLNNSLEAIRSVSSIEDTAQNMRACKDKGQVCAYYSQCYGVIHSEAAFEGMEDTDKF